MLTWALACNRMAECVGLVYRRADDGDHYRSEAQIAGSSSAMLIMKLNHLAVEMILQTCYFGSWFANPGALLLAVGTGDLCF